MEDEFNKPDDRLNIRYMRYTESCGILGEINFREQYDITCTGEIIMREFEGKTRKAKSIQRWRVSQKAVNQFYREILDCARNATQFFITDDDCCGELKIFYDFEHTETMPRGLCSENDNIMSIVGRFLSTAETENGEG